MSGHRQRNILYAIIFALETDLREIVVTHLLSTGSLNEFLSAETRKLAHDRWAKTRTDLAEDEPNPAELITFLDLGDTLQCVQRNAKRLPDWVSGNLSKFYGKIESIIPIRNRVMHARPLEFDDFDRVTDCARQLTLSLTSGWMQVRETMRELRQNPDYASSVQIPDYFEEPSTTLHNLPSPDFDDTGFLGRSKEVESLRKALLGAYPIITVRGEGGVGKSALALKVAYDFVDDPDQPFEAIVWTTAKANKLTLREVVAIDGAIRTSMGIFESAADYLGRNTNSDPLYDLHQHLTHNRILLIIDNLETILDDAIRQFASDLSGHSKILFTTRIGLGAYDFPIPLGAFPTKDARHYLRRTCQVWGVNDVAKFPDSRLDDYCKRLQYNPLFIKWFVQGLDSGLRPDELLANPKILLQYCLQNVFDHLSEDAKLTAYALLTIGGEQTQPALAFFTKLPTDRLQVALSSLISANIVLPQRSSSQGGEDSYHIGSLALFYLGNYNTPSVALQRQLLERRNILRTQQDQFASAGSGNPYTWGTIQQRSADDYYVCNLLRQAIHLLTSGDVDLAEAHVRQAFELSPNFFEVRRVQALVLAAQKNFVAAESEFEAAISLNPNSAPLRFWYANFLVRNKLDYERATDEYVEARKLHPENPNPPIELARVLLYRRRFDEAREALASVGDMSGAPKRLRRIYTDLRIQLECRQADTLTYAGQYEEALHYLNAGMAIYSNATQGDVDTSACGHIVKLCRFIMPTLHRNFWGTPREREIVIIESWLNELAQNARGGGIGSDVSAVEFERRHVGHIFSLREEGYGFVERSDGWRLFFHRSQLIGSVLFDGLAVGMEVTFGLGRNERGLCAIQLEVQRH